MKNILKSILIFIISIIVIYSLLTATKLAQYCKMYQVSIFSKQNVSIEDIDKLKLQGLGNSVRDVEKLREKDDKYNNYDLEGYAVWLKLQSSIGEIFTTYSYLSVLIAFSVAISYFVMNLFKTKNLFKILLCYFIPLIIMSTIYYNTVNNVFIGNLQKRDFIIIFVIIYTVAFAIVNLISKVKIKVEKTTKE